MLKSHNRWFSSGWLLLLLILLLLPTAVQAQSKSLYWKRYDVDISVLQNGDLRIEEQQSIVFTSGNFHYGYRTIPLDKTDGIVDIELWEGSRQFSPSPSQEEYTFTARQDGDELAVYWYFPYTSNSEHTYTFRYTVKGGIRIYSEQEGDSVFWKAIPADHSFPIKNSRVTVRFPEGVQFGDIVSFGTPTEYSTESNSVTFVATQQLPAGQEMEVGVAFQHGLVSAEKPDWQRQKESADIFNLILGVVGVLLLVGGLLSVFLLWYLRGRDPEVGLAAEYLSEPPSEIPPGVAGTLVDEKADMQDVVASLVDLARRGYLEMVETESSQGLLGLGRGSEFTFRRTAKGWDDLLSFEQTIMEKIFGKRQQRPLSDLKNQFYSAIPNIHKGLYQQTVAYQFFRTDPNTVRGRYAGLGVGLLVLAAGLGFALISMLADTVGGIICPFVGIGATAIAIIIIGQAMPVKTRKGAEEAAKWKAFKQYLKEIDRYANLEEATGYFDRYLPYAIAFGLERSWINKFASVPSTPIPMWYYPVWMGAGHQPSAQPSPSGGNPPGKPPSLDGLSTGMATGLSSMSAGLTSMLNTASSTLVSRPQSSGGSGGSWGGGGFSGGGGGGGGSAGFG